MTSAELSQALQQYGAGLDAELALLRQLEQLQGDTASPDAGDVAQLTAVADERERLVATLVTLEHQLKPLRAALADARDLLRGLAAFESVAARHREAGELVARILSSDHQALHALREAETVRRAAASAVERGETTLAAYRRVVAPQEGARIMNRRG